MRERRQYGAAVDPTAGGALRTARALLVAGTAFATAAGAHLAAGGGTPPPHVAAALLALTAAAVLPVSGVRAFRVRVLAPVGAALQVALHHALAAAGAGGAGAAGGGSAHHVRAGAVRADAAAAPVPADAHVLLHDLPMLLAHGAAAVLTAVVLVATDRAARAATGRLAGVLPLLAHPTAPVRVTRRPSAPVAAQPPLAPVGAALGPSARRRGPPAAVPAVT